MLASGTSHPFWQIPSEVSMHFLSYLLMTASAGAAAAASAIPNDQPIVEVYMPPVLGLGMDHAFGNARGIVNEIYSGIGVRVVWRSTRSAPLGCAKQPLSGKIVVALREGTPAGLSRQALAFSNPYSTEGPCVTLLLDRLNEMLKTSPLSLRFLLGHILAHEMGHVLQGIARHSETGVMKGLWSEGDIMDMPKKRLRFTIFDKELILEDLAARGQR
jgi:hypothetical protein